MSVIVVAFESSSLRPRHRPDQGTREGYPYHGPMGWANRFVHGRGILHGYPGPGEPLTVELDQGLYRWRAVVVGTDRP
jgi:hypothetical protein